MVTSQKAFSLRSLITQGLLSILYAVLTFTLCAFLFFLGFNIWYAGRIFPGIYFDTIALGSLSRQEAQQIIQTQVIPALPQSITLTYQDQTWNTNLLAMGISYDPQQIADFAFSIGRSGSPAIWLGDVVALLSGNKSIPPAILFNEAAAAETLSEIAQELDRPVEEARISFESSNVTTTPGQIGRTLDIEQSLEVVREALRQQSLAIIPLRVSEAAPDILDAEPYAQTIREFLASDFVLVTPEEYAHPSAEQPLTASVLSPMLELVKKNQDGQISITLQFKESVLQNLLDDLASKFNVDTANPRFIFNDSSGEIELYANGIIGRTLNVAASVSNIQQQIASGAHEAVLVFDYTAPRVADTASGTELGITELVAHQRTYFYGSSSARVQNIKAAAGRFLGILVAPGEVFSMAQHLGEISLDTGFTEALIIYNGKTIEGVGGGVCQVSTTLFRTAFFGGYPILERYPHAYRVSYYEQIYNGRVDTNLAGLDATVYVPLVDLKFQNDSPYWLLMEAYVYPESSQIEWKFYSTSDGRSVEWKTSGPTNIVEPPETKYYLNTQLSRGEIKQVDWEAEGSDVRVERWVYKNGALYFQDQFLTHYEPWGAVYEIGPGVDGYPISEE
ncbi:MAG TPA: VanW family protein [Anaerolineaceae bacterium]|nr:VanW family protein [Anaerolineaceae bacterium]